MSDVKTSDVATTIQQATRRIALQNPTTPRLDAELILACALGVSREALIMRGKEALTPEQAGVFATMLKRRLAGEPVAYITGVKEFWGMPFAVSRAVLIPRPDTETLVEAVLEIVRSKSHISKVDTEPNIVPNTASPCLSTSHLIHTRYPPPIKDSSAEK